MPTTGALRLWGQARAGRMEPESGERAIEQAGGIAELKTPPSVASSQ